MGRRLGLAAAGTTLLYLLILGLQPVFLISSPRLVELRPWMAGFARNPPDLAEPWLGIFMFLDAPVVKVAVFVAILVGLFAAYAVAYRAARAGEGSAAWILGGFALFAVVLAPGLPIFSNDVFSYIAHGELVDTKHVSPYEVRMEDHRDLAVSRYGPRLRLGSVYGPLALRVFQGLHVTAASPVANLMILKAVWIVLLLAAQLLVYRALLGLGRDPPVARGLLVLFAWNPLVLIEGVLNAHVDVLILVLLSLGAFLVVRRRTVVGLAVMAASAAVKVTFLFLAPVLLAWAWRSAASEGDARPRAGVLRGLQLVGLGAVLNLVWLLPDWTGGSPLTALSELGGSASNSLTFALRRGLVALGSRFEHLPTIMAAGFALLVVFRSWELRTVPEFLARVSRDVMLALLFFLSVVYPWYALAAFPLVIVGGVRRHLAALLTFSGCFLLAAYGQRMAVVLPTVESKLFKFGLGVLPAACVFLFGTDAVRRIIRRT